MLFSKYQIEHVKLNDDIIRTKKFATSSLIQIQTQENIRTDTDKERNQIYVKYNTKP